MLFQMVLDSSRSSGEAGPASIKIPRVGRTLHLVFSILFSLVLIFNVAVTVTRIDLHPMFADRRRLYHVLAASVIALGLRPFQSTGHNLRYLVPILPFLAVVLKEVSTADLERSLPGTVTALGRGLLQVDP